METDTKVESLKEKVNKINIPVSKLVYGTMMHVDVQKKLSAKSQVLVYL